MSNKDHKEKNQRADSARSNGITDSGDSGNAPTTGQETGSGYTPGNEDRQAVKQQDAKRRSETDKDGPLYTFFTNGLKDLYFAEKELKDALTKMQEAATTAELQDAFEDHGLLTRKHITRLEKVFRSLGEDPEAKKCEAILGLIKEGETVIEETEEGSMTRDAALIIAAQKAEHYEIASYGGLAALAETLRLPEASELLHRTLQEEEETDRSLTDIAERYINFAAKQDDMEVQMAGEESSSRSSDRS